MKEKITFLKNSGIYFLGDFLSKLVTFFLLPIYSKYILPADFGYFDLTTSYLMLLIPLVTAEIWIGMMRFIKEETNQNNIKNIISNSFYIIILNIILLAVSIIIYTIFDMHIKYFNLICTLGFLYVLQKFYIYLCRSISSTTVFIVSGILNTITAATSNYIMIVYLKMGVTSLFIASILGLILQIVIIEYHTHFTKLFSFKYVNVKMLQKLLKFSYPIAFGSILYFFLMYYNKLILENQLGLASNGFFAIASKFTIVIVFLTSAFTMAWQDLSFTMGEDKSNFKKYENAITLYTKVILGGTGIIIMLLHFIFPIMIDQKYDASYAIIPLSIVSVVLAAIGNFISQTLGALKKTNIIVLTSLISTICNVLFIKYFIHKYGINGVNVALIATFLINIIVRFCYLQFSLKIKINFFLMPLLLLYLYLIIMVYNTRDTTYNVAGIILAAIVFILLIKKDFLEVFKKVCNNVLIK